MRTCAVLNCTNNSSTPSLPSNNITFHLFPKDPETRQAWIYATGRLNWTPQPNSTICSEHFTEYDFTTKNGKKFLRSTTVPRFNLNEQNSRYTESQYHNETQAALEFLTGQLFPENQAQQEPERVQQQQPEKEVVTVQVIGGKNPNVVVRKPQVEPQNKPNPPEKKPKYFSIVNVFKSEAELKAEKEKIHELIRENLDPSISQVLLSLDDPPVKKKKKKKNGENSTQEDNDKPNPTSQKPRAKNGQFLKVSKKALIDGTSEGHYTDLLTREEIIHKLKQRDIKISQLQVTIRNLQKTHLRDQVELESLRIKLKLKSNQTDEEPTSEPVVETPQYSHSNVGFKRPAQQQVIKRQKVVTQKRQRPATTNTENLYQSDRNVSDQDQAYFDTQTRRTDIGFKRPPQQLVLTTTHKQRLEATNAENNYQSDSNSPDQNQAYFVTQNRNPDVGFKKPARHLVVKQKRQKVETKNIAQSSTNFSDHYQTFVNTQNRHSDVGLNKPAQQRIVIQQQEIVIPVQNTENRNQANMIFSDQDRTHFWNF